MCARGLDGKSTLPLGPWAIFVYDMYYLSPQPVLLQDQSFGLDSYGLRTQNVIVTILN